MTAPQLYFHLKKTLEQRNIPSAQFEAMCIAAHIFGENLRNILFERKTATDEQINVCNNILFRRIHGEPLQYLLGKWEFYGLPFYVGDGVLIPRQDTETLVDTILNAHIPQAPKILDLCSGSGCIGITLSKKIPLADVTAVEISEKASGYINRNNRLNGTYMRLVTGDVLNEKVAGMFSEVDVIACNPPYLTERDMKNLQKEVTFEPSLALFGGKDGLKFYRIITELWKSTLKSGGMLVYEIGMGQEKDVEKILSDNKFCNISTADDLCGITRVVFGYKS